MTVEKRNRDLHPEEKWEGFILFALSSWRYSNRHFRYEDLSPMQQNRAAGEA
jgi:hypothetical protein